MSDVDMGFMDQDMFPVPSYDELLSHTIRLGKEVSDKDVEISALKDSVSRLEMQLAYQTFMLDDSSSTIEAPQFAKPDFTVTVPLHMPLHHPLHIPILKVCDVFCRSRSAKCPAPRPRMEAF